MKNRLVDAVLGPANESVIFYKDGFPVGIGGPFRSVGRVEEICRIVADEAHYAALRGDLDYKGATYAARVLFKELTPEDRELPNLMKP